MNNHYNSVELAAVSKIEPSYNITTEEESQQNLSNTNYPNSSYLKRTLDIIGALIGILISIPISILIIIAIKIEDGGPIFFKQTRSGIIGINFIFYKFRSMNVKAESQQKDILSLNEMSGPVFKIHNDPRVTLVGRILRKTSMDELPQFLNVLKGDMSLVGPRPPIPSEVLQYEKWQLKRLSVKPGITCLWQISGRNNIDFDQWMNLDIYYIENSSFWFDLKIIFKTIPAIVRGNGAS